MVPSIECKISLPSLRRALKSSSKISSMTLILKHVSSLSVFNGRVDIKDHSFSPSYKIELLLIDSNHCISNVKKGLPKTKGTLLSFFVSRITKSIGKVNLPTLTSIFSAIPTEYWNDWSANLTHILLGLRVSRDNFAYKEYGMRLMLAPRSAKAMHEKALLKLHRIRKLPGSPSLGGTLF
nr:hypothetical protein [Tanacetum cinerariifolium]